MDRLQRTDAGHAAGGARQTIVATALPTIVDDLGGLEHIAWVTGVPEARIATVTEELRERGLITGPAGAAEVTPAGRALVDQLLAARREELEQLLEAGDRPPEVQALLERLSRALVGERPR